MMPGFRWEVANDIALAMEVVSKRHHKPADWVDIADTLAKAFSTEEKPVSLEKRRITTHATRERMLPYHIWKLDKLTLCSRYLDGGNRCLCVQTGQSLSVRGWGRVQVLPRSAFDSRPYILCS